MCGEVVCPRSQFGVSLRLPSVQRAVNCPVAVRQDMSTEAENRGVSLGEKGLFVAQ